MDFGPVAPRGADVGGMTPDASSVARRAATSPASQVGGAAAQAASARPPDGPEMRTVGDAQRLAGFLRATAEELAASEAGTEGDGGGGASPEEAASVAHMVTLVEKHAARIFNSILESVGDDRRLLEQAKGYVAKVFEEFKDRDPEPMLARMTHERVIDLIDSRLREITENKDVDFSA